MASQRKKNQENIRFQVIKFISENPEVSTRKVAKKIGISNGSAYYVISALIEKGFVKFGNFWSNPNKANYAYLLTPKGIREKYYLTSRFLERKKLEYKELEKEIKALERETNEFKKNKTI